MKKSLVKWAGVAVLLVAGVVAGASSQLVDGDFWPPLLLGVSIGLGIQAGVVAGQRLEG